MTDRPADMEPLGDAPRRQRRAIPAPSARTLLLGGALMAAIAAYILTGPARAELWERVWAERLEVEWARKRQEEALEQRKLRADLRQQLRRLAEEPEDVDAVLKAASYYAQLREYDDAVFMLGEAERLRPKDPEVYRAKGQAYLSSGKYDRALEAAEQGLAIAPDDLELNLMRLNLDAVLGWAKQAQPRMKDLLGKHGREARVHLMAALLARQVADPRASQEHLREAMRLDPNNDKVYGLLAGLELELGHREEALKLVHRAIELSPRDADYHLLLAEALRTGAGDDPHALRESERTYRRALELKPDSSQAKHGIAVCRLALGDPEGQIMLEELLKVQPHLPAPKLELSKLYSRQGRRSESAQLLNAYQANVRENDDLKGLSLRLAMQPANPVTYREMGELHLRTGYPEKAIVFLRHTLRMDPKDGQARDLLARALHQAGRSGEVQAVLAAP